MLVNTSLSCFLIIIVTSIYSLTLAFELETGSGRKGEFFGFFLKSEEKREKQKRKEENQGVNWKVILHTHSLV